MARWVDTQYMRFNKGKMSDERIQILQKAGFTLTPENQDDPEYHNDDEQEPDLPRPRG